MMASVGLPIDQLQRAAPIVSGFLLGYVAMLPLIGRIADLRGRVPVLVGGAGRLRRSARWSPPLAYDMPSMVAGRFLQGVGGGGLVPATLALVADLYPAERRGVPLGVVSRRPGARQRRSARCSAPLVLAVADWRAIFADQPGRRPGARRRHPRARRPVTERSDRRSRSRRRVAATGSGGLLLLRHAGRRRAGRSSSRRR